MQQLRSRGFQVVERARPVEDSSALESVHFVNHGGLAVIANAEIKLSVVNRHLLWSSFECLCVHVSSQGKTCVLVAIYRPGSANITAGFFKEFNLLLDSLLKFQCPVFLTGDINIHLERKDDVHSCKFMDILRCHDLVQHIDQPTHDLGGILDILISDLKVPLTSVAVDDVGLSDHKLLRWTSVLKRPVQPLYVTRERRVWTNFKADRFRADLSQSVLCLPDCLETTLDQMIYCYNNVISDLLDSHAPVKTVTYRQRPSDLWYNKHCRDTKKEARRLERRYKRTRSQLDRDKWIDALKHSHRVVDCTRSAYWKETIESSTNSRQLWHSINSVLGRGKKSQSGSCSGLSAQTLGQFFTDKINRLRQATEDVPPPTFTACQSGVSLNHFQPATHTEVCRLIMEAPLKQSGDDPLPMWLLKQCVDLLSPFLTAVVNRSVTTGVVPAVFKTAIITPRLKKQGLDPSLPENYRPVSNLCFLSKLTERVVCRQLTGYLTEFGLMPHMQSAYRRGHSTETALLKVYNDLVSAADNGHVSFLALLDLSSAFDTVDHDILIRRLKDSYGLNNGVIHWLSSYLEGRSERFVFNNQSTNEQPVQCGVPQGSVLGPLLFTLYIADIYSVIDIHGLQAHLYADDCQMYLSCGRNEVDHGRRQLSECFASVSKWMVSNRLCLNVTKTDLIFCDRQSSPQPTPVSLADSDVIPAKVVRDLGVEVDSDLSLAAFVGQLVRSSYFRLRGIRSCRRSLPLGAARQLVNSLVVSRLDYCNSLLHGAPQYLLDKLQMVFNSAARLIYNGSSFDHVSPWLRELSWLRVPNRITYKVACMVYKSLHGLAPGYLTAMLVPVNDSRYRLRSATSTNLNVPRTRTRIGDRAFSACGPKIWNSLPDSVKQSPSYAVFKRRLHRYLSSDSTVH